MQKVERVRLIVERTPNEGRIVQVLKSAGVLDTDVDEIVQRVAILDLQQGRWGWLNLFFHYLPSGWGVLGRLTPCMDWPSLNLTDPEKVNLQYLLASPELLRSFGNNPVQLYQELLFSGKLSTFLRAESLLTAIEAPNGRSDLDEHLLHGLKTSLRADTFAILTQSILDSISTIFTGTLSGLYLVAAMFELFPIAWRPELTFSLGLCFHETPDFRLMGLDRRSDQTIARYKEGTLPFFDLDEMLAMPRPYNIVEGWALFILDVFYREAWLFYTAKLQEEQRKSNTLLSEWGSMLETIPLPTLDEMNEKGFAWLEELQSWSPTHSNNSDGPDSKRNFNHHKEVKAAIILPEPEIFFLDDEDEELEWEQPLTQFSAGRLFSPYQRLLALWPEYRDHFLQLDSHIANTLEFDSFLSLPTKVTGELLAFQSVAIEKLTRFWNHLHAELPNNVLWAIREEYIHYLNPFLVAGPEETKEQNIQDRLFILDILDLLIR